MTKLKVQIQKLLKKPSQGIISVVGEEDSVLVTLTVEAHNREAASRVMDAVASFTEKLKGNEGDSQ